MIRRKRNGSVAGIGLIAIAMLVATGTAGAADGDADESGWDFGLDLLFLNAHGAGDGIAVSRQMFGTGFFEVDRTDTELDLDGSVTLRFEVGRRTGAWGWGIDGWIYDTDGDAGVSGLTGDFANGLVVSVFDGLTGASAPDVSTGETMSVTATRELDITNFDVHASRVVARGDRSGLEATVGLRIGSLESERRSSLVATNLFTVDAVLNVDTGMMFGPSASLRAFAKHKRHRFEGRLGQAIVVGDADRTLRASTMTTGTDSASTVTSGTSSAIPVTEVQGTWMYDVNDGFSIGGGLFASVWHDAPSLRTVGVGDIRETITVAGAMFGVRWH